QSPAPFGRDVYLVVVALRRQLAADLQSVHAYLLIDTDRCIERGAVNFPLLRGQSLQIVGTILVEQHERAPPRPGWVACPEVSLQVGRRPRITPHQVTRAVHPLPKGWQDRLAPGAEERLVRRGKVNT